MSFALEVRRGLHGFGSVLAVKRFAETFAFVGVGFKVGLESRRSKVLHFGGDLFLEREHQFQEVGGFIKVGLGARC
jgi:hypothetical protein